MKRGTPDHPKMHDLASRLGITRSHAVGIMETLWHWAEQYCPDGNVGRWTPAVMARAVDWAGNPLDLTTALIEARWLDQSDGLLLIHGWAEHCFDSVHVTLAMRSQVFACGTLPHKMRTASIAQRTVMEAQANTQKPKKQRAKPQKQPADNRRLAAGQPPVTGRQHADNMPSSSSSPSPSPSPSPEEKSNTECSEPEDRLRAVPAVNPVPITLQIAWTGTGWANVTEGDLAAWAVAYPACNLTRQLAAAGEWVKANPTKAKKNYRRFLGNWLSRSQERGGDTRAAPTATWTQPERPLALVRNFAQERRDKLLADAFALPSTLRATQ